ncbi:hypothetical protein HBH43_050780 [Parastagonospora nodorum]|nr:hypothetical protein HBH43_050780 [Parastagonospora nodorum]KAH4606405.1 hypothetical protein HBH82_103950 [Parastagonospora nodorum]KAH4713161.1 hypothetical protein HBH67_007270 [Parastagonospora nodorum]KAH4792156.1 hypothetical protein HBH62_022460 [Parastagonospora nodorum]
MLYPSTLLVAFFAWSQVAIASNTQQLCFTHQTSVSPKGAVKTTSLIRSITFTRPLTITTTPGTTVTPETQKYTSTITSTATSYTTLPQQVDTYTSTITVQTTMTSQEPQVTSTVSSSTTVTETSTIRSTTTVPAPAGFTGALGTLPNSVAKRRRSLDRRARQVLKPRLLKPKPQTYYPDSVTCVGVVETIVYKAFTTATAPTPTTTLSATTTTTVTVTVGQPAALTTQTTTTTSTLVQTIPPDTTVVTSIGTTTISATIYQATDYAICASNNYAGGANGKGIDDYDTNPALPFLGFTTDTSKEACCRSCAANPLCAGTAYYDPQAGGWRCQLIGTGSGQCSAGQYELMAGQAQEVPVGQGLYVSNGKCAKWSSTY